MEEPSMRTAGSLAHLLAVGLCLIGTTGAVAQEVDTARAAGASFLIRTQQGDGSWRNAGGLEIQATASALEALERSGLRGSQFFAAGAAWLANVEPGSVDAETRRILALKIAGRDVGTDAQALASKRSSTSGYSFGSYPGHGTTVIDTALGLNALRLGLSGFAVDGQQVANSLCPVLNLCSPETNHALVAPIRLSDLRLFRARGHHVPGANHPGSALRTVRGAA